jgi:glycine dehydrogenase subunit 1
MRYIPVSCEQREAMLRAVGVPAVDDLFEAVPDSVLLREPLDLPDGLTEMEAAARLRGLADENTPASRLVSFAGAGCYDHYIPAVVDDVLRKPEFFTAYTPYQPEVSQGTLQNIYEYQTMICELTGMDVANASMYDGATAFVEAALMAVRATKRSRVVVSGAAHPEWLATLETYAKTGVMRVDTIVPDGGTGTADLAAVRMALSNADDPVAAVLVSSPTFFGTLEDVAGLAEAVHAAGALLVVATNPILLGVLEAPGVSGADIVVGEGQVLGNPMSFGGPGLGFFACRTQHLRSLPGRVVGRTVDVEGRGAFVLTMQTREQHIRRERATSNICSNHALNALAAAVYLSSVGSAGLESIGRACVAKAHYLHDALVASGRFSSVFDAPFAHEFTLAFDGDVTDMRSAMLERGFLAGVPVAEVPGPASAAVPERAVLFAVTEKRTRAQMDAFIAEVVSL